MPPILVNRKTIRERLATELTTAYGGSVHAVYPYMATGFEGRSPVVRVVNGGSFRPALAGQSTEYESSRFRYAIQHFVLYSEDASDSYDQQAAEDALDNLEFVLTGFMSDNYQLAGVWKAIGHIDYSEPVLTRISNAPYLLEVFGVEVAIDG